MGKNSGRGRRSREAKERRAGTSSDGTHTALSSSPPPKRAAPSSDASDLPPPPSAADQKGPYTRSMTRAAVEEISRMPTARESSPNRPERTADQEDVDNGVDYPAQQGGDALLRPPDLTEAEMDALERDTSIAQARIDSEETRLARPASAAMPRPAPSLPPSRPGQGDARLPPGGRADPLPVPLPTAAAERADRMSTRATVGTAHRLRRDAAIAEATKMKHDADAAQVQLEDERVRRATIQRQLSRIVEENGRTSRRLMEQNQILANVKGRLSEVNNQVRLEEDRANQAELRLNELLQQMNRHAAQLAELEDAAIQCETAANAYRERIRIANQDAGRLEEELGSAEQRLRTLDPEVHRVREEVLSQLRRQATPGVNTAGAYVSGGHFYGRTLHSVLLDMHEAQSLATALRSRGDRDGVTRIQVEERNGRAIVELTTESILVSDRIATNGLRTEGRVHHFGRPAEVSQFVVRHPGATALRVQYPAGFNLSEVSLVLDHFPHRTHVYNETNYVDEIIFRRHEDLIQFAAIMHRLIVQGCQVSCETME